MSWASWPATINTMGADIRQMLDAKRALLLAISHELRSPLTRARLNTELLPDTSEVQPSREALLRDLALMRDLVTDLLESERLASPPCGAAARANAPRPAGGRGGQPRCCKARPRYRPGTPAFSPPALPACPCWR